MMTDIGIEIIKSITSKTHRVTVVALVAKIQKENVNVDMVAQAVLGSLQIVEMNPSTGRGLANQDTVVTKTADMKITSLPRMTLLRK